jgi:hypothetical protein
MEYVLHKAETRGGGNLGWLRTKYSFSFANWYEPTRMGFGALRVINDDWIAPQSGFGEHSHNNFEIITIVRGGAVTHKDSMGNMKEVKEGEVQVMSAGTGVTHAEFNSGNVPLELFQIWIEPNAKNIPPRYDQEAFSKEDRKNVWQVVVSGGAVSGSLVIQQDARIALADIVPDDGEEKSLEYTVTRKGSGVYLMVVEGSVTVLSEKLGPRDAIGIKDVESISISADGDASLLLIEVPMV